MSVFQTNSDLARRHSRNGELDVGAGLEDILSQRGKSVQVFVDMTEPRTANEHKGGTRLAYHLGDVGGEIPVSCLYIRTVEFRQHKGSLDFEELEIGENQKILGILRYRGSRNRRLWVANLR